MGGTDPKGEERKRAAENRRTKAIRESKPKPRALKKKVDALRGTDPRGDERRRAVESRRTKDLRDRAVDGKSKLRIKGDLNQVAAARKRKLDAKKVAVDRAGVTSVVGGGLPTLGRGRR
jgi:hypothetical protein